MNDRPLYFVSGLPRSGSTVLLNLLAQNPAIHVTPTSGLIELFVTIHKRWPEFLEFKTEGLEQVKPRVESAMRGLLHGYFQGELDAGKTVFDKSRGWLQYIELVEEVLGRRVKIVVTVRDVRAIVASFEKLYRRRGIDFRTAAGDDFYKCQTIEGRARCLLATTSVLGLTIARLRDALARGVADRLVIVPFQALTATPRLTLDKLSGMLGLAPYVYDPDHVEQVTHENDLYHGLDLHTLRPCVEPPSEAPWQGILPAELCDWLADEYADVIGLCGPPRAGTSTTEATAEATTEATIEALTGNGLAPSRFDRLTPVMAR